MIDKMTENNSLFHRRIIELQLIVKKGLKQSVFLNWQAVPLVLRWKKIKNYSNTTAKNK